MSKSSVVIAIFASMLLLTACSQDSTSANASASTPAANQQPASSAAIATGVAGDDCKTLVSEVHSVCMDSITAGLDMSCSTQMVKMGVLRKQASGNLFDVGSKGANAKTVARICASNLESLQEKRSQAKHLAEDADGPKCEAFANRFESMCLNDIAAQPWPRSCKTASTMFAMGRGSRPAEDRCAMAMSFLGKEEG